MTEISTTSSARYTRLCPSCRGETTLRSSHHCNWRRLTPQIRATSVLVYWSLSGRAAGRSFFVLNISPRFRFGKIAAILDCTLVLDCVKRQLKDLLREC